MVDEVLKQLSPRFDKMYAKADRSSIPPEQLLLVAKTAFKAVAAADCKGLFFSVRYAT